MSKKKEPCDSSKETLITEFEKVMKLAKTKKDYASYNRAIEGIARLVGVWKGDDLTSPEDKVALTLRQVAEGKMLARLMLDNPSLFTDEALGLTGGE